jgi:hypothetical protein
MQIQSILFDKRYFKKSETITWLKNHGYKTKFVPASDAGKTETINFYRYRQELPDYNIYYYSTKHIKIGIQMIVGYPKKIT